MSQRERHCFIFTHASNLDQPTFYTVLATEDKIPKPGNKSSTRFMKKVSTSDPTMQKFRNYLTGAFGREKPLDVAKPILTDVGKYVMWAGKVNNSASFSQRCHHYQTAGTPRLESPRGHTPPE